VEGFREGVREKGLNLVFAGFRFAGLVYGDKNFFSSEFFLFLSWALKKPLVSEKDTIFLNYNLL
jgi:hypothetical protein